MVNPELGLAEKLESLARQIDEEVENWKAAGMDPGHIGFNLFMLDSQVGTLMKVVQDKGIITEDELNLIFREKVLHNLKTQREKFQPEIQRERIAAGIEKPRLVLPNDYKLQ